MNDRQPGWIAVSERLPRKKERDIWTWNGESVLWIESTGALIAEDLKDVTHWMPKVPPSPPLPPGRGLPFEAAVGTFASNGQDDREALAASLPALLLQAVEALEKSEQYGAGSWPNLIAALRLHANGGS